MLSRSSFLPLVLVFGFLTGCATQTAPTAAPKQGVVLTDLMVSRLEISREVAWIKFMNHLPVRDAKREGELIERMVKEGEALGLSPVLVSAFFRAQIDASCQVQKELLRYWQRGGTLPTFAPSDLKRDIRPKLDALGSRILRELVLLQRSQERAQLESYAYGKIREKGFSWRVARIAVAPLD